MSGWVGVGETADLLLFLVHQPPHTSLWWVTINKRPVLVRYVDRMPNQLIAQRVGAVGTKPGTVIAVLYQILYQISFLNLPKSSYELPA